MGASGPLAPYQIGLPLYADEAYRFCVVVDGYRVRDANLLDELCRIVDREKPAHTDYRVQVVAPEMRVGFQARLGIDAIVGGDPRTVVLDAALLGIETRLPRNEVARVGDASPGRHVVLELESEKAMNPYDNAETLLRVLARTAPQPVFLRQAHGRSALPHGAGLRPAQAVAAQPADLGNGVLCGLRVVIDDGRLYVDPGVAIDGLGREIVVPVRSCVDLAAPATSAAAATDAESEGCRAKRALHALGVLSRMQCRLPAGARVGLRYTCRVRCRARR